MSLNLEYVFSAPSMMRLQRTKWSQKNPEGQEKLRLAICEGIIWIRNESRRIMADDKMKMSVLFNAFVESTQGAFIDNQGAFEFDNVYGDSGGLQMVTRDIEITDDLRRGVYTVQDKFANFGFCFDEIPLGLKPGADAGKKHRSQTSSKQFKNHEHDECAARTARNIKEQTDFFHAKGGNTKAFYILQGNDSSHMVSWFEAGLNAGVNWDCIQGLAPADTCIGNGELESVEMLRACHILKDRYGTKTGNHIHLLGVGSTYRLIPAIFLKQSGFINNDIQLSFDSSSSSMSFMMGNFFNRDGSKPGKDIRKEHAMFSEFYDDLGHILEKVSPGITKKEFLDYLIPRYKSMATLINEAPPHIDVAIRATATLVILWQNVGFYNLLAKQLVDPEILHSPLGYLKQVKTLDDVARWERDFSKYVSSKRIERVPSSTLEDLFE